MSPIEFAREVAELEELSKNAQEAQLALLGRMQRVMKNKSADDFYRIMEETNNRMESVEEHISRQNKIDQGEKNIKLFMIQFT